MEATLSHDIGSNGPREQYARAHVERSENGYRARVFENQDSSLLSLYAACNALVVRAPNAEKAFEDDNVEFIALRNID